MGGLPVPPLDGPIKIIFAGFLIICLAAKLGHKLSFRAQLKNQREKELKKQQENKNSGEH